MTNSAVRTAPMPAAQAAAVMASSPRVAPMTRCSTISTGTGRAPPEMSRASSRASASSKDPVIWVVPPPIPAPQAMAGSMRGEEMILSSRTMAIRRRGSPAGWQAASAVAFAHRVLPASVKSTVMCQPAPLCRSNRASAPLTSSPSDRRPSVAGAAPSRRAGRVRRPGRLRGLRRRRPGPDRVRRGR